MTLKHPERGHALSAKKTEAPRNRGGSPTALLLCTSGVRAQGASRSRVTRRSRGMSFTVGILYVPARTGFSYSPHAVHDTVDEHNPRTFCDDCKTGMIA